MSLTLSACAKALASLNSAIDASLKFPANVFIGEWGDYFFFDSDWMFDAEFVERVKRFWAVEGAVCACLVNLDVKSNAEEDRFLCLDEKTTSTAYRSMLNGAGPESGWVYGMDRFGCTSDVSQWCMYCEKGNEIAVVGIRRGVPVEQYLPLIAQLNAVRIQEALALPLAFGFAELLPQWRDGLMEAYTTR